jgi:hypothetical protein
VAWYYAQAGERKGPVDEAALIQMGVLEPGTLVWKAGMAGWAAAGTIPELAGGLKK